MLIYTYVHIYLCRLPLSPSFSLPLERIWTAGLTTDMPQPRPRHATIVKRPRPQQTTNMYTCIHVYMYICIYMLVFVIALCVCRPIYTHSVCSLSCRSFEGLVHGDKSVTDKVHGSTDFVRFFPVPGPPSLRIHCLCYCFCYTNCLV